MYHIRQIITLVLCQIFLVVPLLQANTITVGKNGKKFKSIQKAIDAAKYGDLVIVSPGRYYETLVLRDGVTVRSEGTLEERKDHTAAKRTIIDANGVLKPVVEMAENATIDGFGITGLGKVNHHVPGHPHGVQSRGVSGKIINNIIHDIGSTGIGSHASLGRDAATYIANNEIYNNAGIGIGNNHESSPTVTGNVVHHNDEVGIGSKNGSHPLIEYNVVFANKWTGIGAKDGSFPIIRNNKVYRNGIGKQIRSGAGIGLQKTYAPLVENNEVYQNFLAGIGLRNGVRTVLRGNKSYKNKRAGIGLDNVDKVIIEENDLFENSMAGIGITNKSKGVVIRRNKIHGNIMAGINPTEKPQFKVEENNRIYGNKIPSPYDDDPDSRKKAKELAAKGLLPKGGPPSSDAKRAEHNEKLGKKIKEMGPGASFTDWLKKKK